MFIFSIKQLKHKLLLAVMAVLIVLGVGLVILNTSKQKCTAISEIGEYSLSAKNNDERVKFLSQFGWEVNPTPVETSSVIIPAKFNSVYENYNDIQKVQGLDLSRYKEQSCTRYTYQILNYKDVPGGIRANILVLKDRVIGGDICSVELNGFMHGFVAPEEPKPAYNSNAAKIVNTSPKGFSEEPIKSTFRANLEPDPNNPSAPTD